MGVRTGTYCAQYNEALRLGKVADPCRLLAIGVILRWVEDVRLGKKRDLEIGQEWAELADVPEEWLVSGGA